MVSLQPVRISEDCLNMILEDVGCGPKTQPNLDPEDNHVKSLLNVSALYFIKVY